MNVDKANLKALAEASGLDQWYSAGDLRYCDDKTGEIHGLHHDDSRFIAAASPATVLALLAEIERLDRESQNLSNQLGHCDRDRRVFRAERDQLKAENEALRKQVADDERKLDALLAHCDDGECPTCAQIICPHGGVMHFHHDGCPSCAEHEAAMAKEASRG